MTHADTGAAHTTAEGEPHSTVKRTLTYRHPVWVRIGHWLNVVFFFGLLFSGLQIFNAHPQLYFGKKSTFDSPVLSIDANEDSTRGTTTIFGKTFDTTGVLGLSKGPDGAQTARAFPSWATLPADQDLAAGRRWHFLFAWLFFINGALYLVRALVGGHVRRRFVPSTDELKDIPHSIAEHATLNFPKGEAARNYNVLQKLTYLIVIAILLPLIILAGSTMSPALNSAFPFLLDLFGGRQSARTVHFLAASGLVLFTIVHVVMVLLSGVGNNLRSMITGRYAIEQEKSDLQPPVAETRS